MTKEQLLTLAPTAKAWIVTGLAANFSTIAEPYGILESPRRLCHFLAQAAHESAGFRTLEEYGGQPYWSRYEGRLDLGNNCAGDGVLYHGRGIFQLTGRANYRAMGTKISLGLEDDPHLAGEGDVSLRTACEYWKARRLQNPADSNDITEVTRRINGGFNGLAERKLYFRELKRSVRKTDVLHSHTVETAAQEIAALVLVSALLADARRRAAGGQIPVLRVSFAKILELAVKPMWLWADWGHGVLTDHQLDTIMKRGYQRARQWVTPPRRPRSCPRAVRQNTRAWPRLMQTHSITGPIQFELV